MRTEESCRPEERYLMLTARLTEKHFAEARKAAIKWCAANSKRLSPSNKAALDALRVFEMSNQIIAFVSYSCYADIPKNRVYSTAFDSAREVEMSQTSASLLFGIFWRVLPTQGLEHGQHQVAVFNFPNGIPSLFETLPLYDGTELDNRRWVGLCDIQDWPAINAARSARNPFIERTF